MNNMLVKTLQLLQRNDGWICTFLVALSIFFLATFTSVSTGRGVFLSIIIGAGAYSMLGLLRPLIHGEMHPEVDMRYIRQALVFGPIIGLIWLFTSKGLRVLWYYLA